ncbi:hypothetical protein [Amycolatopsis rifamycinica]|uniref:hypothetical protein n=1 Tax=Amycolatopsis rifamycinica TaxID=287986 RepID=UPI001364756E|nr:hypothetical protein [Amycolatopsis rifamycinica]
MVLPTGPAKAVATCAVALLFACGLRRWVELPSIAFGQWLLEKGERAPAGVRQEPARVR